MNHNNLAAKKVLHEYIKVKNPQYALLIDAPWGTGKTHFIKKETKCQNDETILYVSLNGVTNSTEFDWAIVRAIQPFVESKIGQWGKQFTDFASGIKIFGCSVDLNQVPLAEIVLAKIPDIIIFDDLERCTMKHDQVSGLLNKFIEHEKKRVILIANSDKHHDKESFDSKKEKLIGRTIYIEAEADTALLDFWSNIDNSKGKKFLQSIQSEILEIFYETNHRNLRLLKRALLETCVFISKTQDNLLNREGPMTKVATSYFALSMAFHGGEIDITDLNKRSNYNLFSASDEGDKSSLVTLKEQHPNCDIQAYHNSCLPVDLVSQSLGKGFATEGFINEKLLSTFHFAEIENTPDWVRLWNWFDETEQDLVLLLERIDQKLDGTEEIPAGEILQIYGAKSFLSKMGGLEFTECEFQKAFLKTIDKLASKNLIPAYMPSSNFRDGYGYSTDVGTISYGGYAFEINNLNRPILALMQQHQNRLFKEKFDSYSDLLLEYIENSPSDFIKFFEYNSNGLNFSSTSILHLIPKEQFAFLLIKLFKENRDLAVEVCELLKDRRKSHREELKDEQSWLNSLEDELMVVAKNDSILFQAQVSLLITRHFKLNQ